MNRAKNILIVLLPLMLVGCSYKIKSENSVIKDTIQIQSDSGVGDDIKKLEDKFFNSIKVTSKIVSYNGSNILIKYPSISGLNDKKREDKINNLIMSEVLSYIQPIGNVEEGQHYNLSYEIKYLDDRILSVVYKGSDYSDESAYPIDVFFSTNIDLLNSKKVKLKELIVDEKKLLEAYKLVLNKNCDDEVKKFSYDYILMNFDSTTIINGFNEADETYGLGRYIFSYITEDSLGISWEVPHVSGDHVEIEIPLDLLENALVLE